jgi:hypothetical protein
VQTTTQESTEKVLISVQHHPCVVDHELLLIKPSKPSTPRDPSSKNTHGQAPGSNKIPVKPDKTASASGKGRTPALKNDAAGGDSSAKRATDRRLGTHSYSNYAQYVRSREGSPDTVAALDGADFPSFGQAHFSTGNKRSTSASVQSAVLTVPVSPPITPLIYCGVERSSTEDRDGDVSLLYNVLVSSAYFERSNLKSENIHIAHPSSINKVSFLCSALFHAVDSALISTRFLCCFVDNTGTE